ncbi:MULTISPECIES: DNA repair protein RadC [unclassified Bacillus (in: firmicutes)]|uniref:DNA repair protein RadC n=1 Tax=Bacillus bruguierae TaxID=3127667 RepID=A0ABU8FBP5_9BACI|nr:MULTISPECIES: DNA repair protein RadC [unclassified Bacillus (in: firmicutes)]SFJ82592.1 DNA replication and repair protein RadC [Bacillus sp. 71mf]SFS53141.1 DNA replication and repair protein RadC [Bacillus sp. 103mf]
MSCIRDVVKEDQPRERLLLEGASSLSNTELLAILLRTGSKEESVLTLANQILHHFDGLRMLKDATIEEMTSIHGVGVAKASQLIAAFELGRRMVRLEYQNRYSIRNPEDCARYMMEEMRFLQQEHFVCLYLNTKNQVMHRQTVFIGSLNASIVHPREVFKEAFRRAAASIICLHNHPSGDPTPSREDIEVTKRLVECGKIIGIEILDHIIIGDHKFVSLKDKGHI